VLGVVAGTTGLFAAYHLALPTGPVVAVAAVAEVFIAYAVVLARRAVDHRRLAGVIPSH
jgi:hypothetical protein